MTDAARAVVNVVICHHDAWSDGCPTCEATIDAALDAARQETWRAAELIAWDHIEPVEPTVDTGLLWRNMMAEKIARALAQRAEGREG